MSAEEDQDEVECESASAGHHGGPAAPSEVPVWKSLADQLSGTAVDPAWRLADWPPSPGVQAAMDAAVAGASKGIGFDAMKSAGSLIDATVGRTFEMNNKLIDTVAGVSRGLDWAPQVSMMAKAYMTTLDSVRSPLFEMNNKLIDTVAGVSRGLDWAPQVSMMAKAYMTTLDSVRSPLFEMNNKLIDTVAGVSRGLDWAPQVSMMAKAYMTTLDSVRSPLFEMNNKLIDTVAGVSRGLDWAPQVSMMAKAYMTTLDSVRSPLFEMNNKLIDTVAGVSRGLDWAPQVSMMAKAYMTTLDSVRSPLLETAKLASMRLWSGIDHSAWMDRVMRGQQQAFVDMMRRWSTLADRGLWAARVALRMALRAMEAVRRGDLAGVKQFMRDWLGFTMFPDDLVNSASLVLLDVQAWLPDDFLSLDFDPCPRLRSLTLAEHRGANRLIIDPDLQFNGAPVLSLNKPASGKSNTPLLELVAAKPQPEPVVAGDEDDISDRLMRVWWKFNDRERAILREKGHRGMTWPAAAKACGASSAEGVRLGRKVRRLRSKSLDSPGSADLVVG